MSWMGMYALAHWDLAGWLGMSLRYGAFKDFDGARTGVAQLLQSVTVAPILHLSRLVDGLQPIGVTYARTRHRNDWVDLRLEYRLAHSTSRVFVGEPGVAIASGSGTSHQVTLQLVAN